MLWAGRVVGLFFGVIRGRGHCRLWWRGEDEKKASVFVRLGAVAIGRNRSGGLIRHFTKRKVVRRRPNFVSLGILGGGRHDKSRRITVVVH